MAGKKGGVSYAFSISWPAILVIGLILAVIIFAAWRSGRTDMTEGGE